MPRLDAIIFDLDGTAVPNKPDAMPSQVMINAVAECKQRIHLCAATGRWWSMGKDIIKSLNLHDPCVVSGGAMIIEPQTEKVLWEARVARAALLKIQLILGERKLDIAYSDGPVTYYADFIKDINFEKDYNTLYLLNVPKSLAEQIIKQLDGLEGIAAAKVYSWHLKDGLDIHITNSQATKEHAVIELCRILGIERTNVAGVGDGFNDVHLFNAVGYKVAMGNAVPVLKEASDLVIDPQSEEGLAKFILESVG